MRSVGWTSVACGIGRLALAPAMAASPAFSDYKALVCIFLLGGNDSNNTVVALDPTEYGSYSAIRGSLALSHVDLLAIQSSRTGGRFGLHPSLGRLQALWLQGKCGIVANVGTLVEPLTRERLFARASKIPYQLYSHSDQQQAWETANAISPSQIGWGGTVADLVRDPAVNFPSVVSVSGLSAFCRGRQSKPIVMPPAPAALNRAFVLERPGDMAESSAFRALIAQGRAGRSPALVRDMAEIIADAVAQSEALKSDPAISTEFPATNLGNQLKQVAKLIKFAPAVGLKRQVFFCSLGGFDTHNNQGLLTGNHADLLSELSNAMGAFYDATVELGLGAQVTTFTLSDFNRTLKPGGTGADIGTDHAWGGHHFVMGDAVVGGELHGAFPAMALDGPNDADRGPSARGRWIPTLAVDQYAATLAHWFGVQAGDLPLIFPNLANFGSTNLGFLR
jgi:uncharacterized protein (DUF1501 family)